MKQAAHVTFYSCYGRGTLYIPVSSIVGALQCTHALVLSAQCSCRGVPVMSVVCAKQSLWYAEITNGCDMLNGKATNCIELVKLFDSCACFYK